MKKEPFQDVGIFPSIDSLSHILFHRFDRDATKNGALVDNNHDMIELVFIVLFDTVGYTFLMDQLINQLE